MTGIYIPIQPGGKRPLVSKWSDPDVTDAQVEAWWAQAPEDANSALRLDGLLVIDLDIDKAAAAGDPDPFLTWIEWGGKDSELTVKTPHGLHIYYRLSPEQEQPHAGALRHPDGRLMHIDVKTGPGHYVLVPPSKLSDGGLYEWT